MWFLAIIEVFRHKKFYRKLLNKLHMNGKGLRILAAAVIAGGVLSADKPARAISEPNSPKPDSSFVMKPCDYARQASLSRVIAALGKNFFDDSSGDLSREEREAFALEVGRFAMRNVRNILGSGQEGLECSETASKDAVDFVMGAYKREEKKKKLDVCTQTRKDFAHALPGKLASLAIDNIEPEFPFDSDDHVGQYVDFTVALPPSTAEIMAAEVTDQIKSVYRQRIGNERNWSEGNNKHIQRCIDRAVAETNRTVRKHQKKPIKHLSRR